MCPGNLIHLAAVLLVCVALIHSYKRQRDNARVNAGIVSGLLQSAAVTPGFLNLNFTVEGVYKNRKAGYAYVMSERARSPYAGMFIEPRFYSQPREQPVFQLSYPRPTPDTVYRNGRIYYARETLFQGFVWGGLAVMDASEAQKVLEELSRAAEVVEKQHK